MDVYIVSGGSGIEGAYSNILDAWDLAEELVSHGTSRSGLFIETYELGNTYRSECLLISDPAYDLIFASKTNVAPISSSVVAWKPEDINLSSLPLALVCDCGAQHTAGTHSSWCSTAGLAQPKAEL